MTAPALSFADWSRALDDALSLAAVAPSMALVLEIRGLLDTMPSDYVPAAWLTLRRAALDWLMAVDRALPNFTDTGLLVKAEAALPLTCRTHWADA